MWTTTVFLFVILSYGSVLSGAHPVIELKSGNINFGFNQIMNVMCSFQQGQESALSDIFSLLLSYSTKLNDPYFVQIASVDNSDGLVKSNHVKSSNTSGLLDNNGLSYVNVDLSDNFHNNVVMYKCEVIGTTSQGKHVSVSTYTTTKTKTSCIEDVFEANNEIRLQKDFLALQNQFYSEMISFKSFKVETLKTLDVARERISKLEIEKAAIKSDQERFKSALESATESYFIKSDPFEGKIYLLSREASFYYPSFAQSICSLFGGYLVEVDTWAEFNFLKNFVNTNDSQFWGVMTGGTDEGHEGQWINRYTKTPVVSSFWEKNQPDNSLGKQNCQMFLKVYNWNLDDGFCQVNSDGGVGFICEVPQ